MKARERGGVPGDSGLKTQDSGRFCFWLAADPEFIGPDGPGLYWIWRKRAGERPSWGEPWDNAKTFGPFATFQEAIDDTGDAEVRFLGEEPHLVDAARKAYRALSPLSSGPGSPKGGAGLLLDVEA